MQRITFLVGLAGLFATTYPQTINAAPANPASKPALEMPNEVRSLMAPGAKTMHFARYAAGVKGAPLLLHIWKAERRSSTTPLYSSVPSPVCADFFSRSAVPNSKWELVATTSYLDSNEAWQHIHYKTHWMEPKTSQGLVIEQQNSSSDGYCIRLFTLPLGVAPEILDEFGHPVYLQEFRGAYQGGTMASASLKRSPRGQLTVEEEITVKQDVPDTHNTYEWNGSRWDRVATRQQSRR